MSKYMKYQRKTKPKKQVPPIWRGIGCIMMLVVPVLSYVVGYAFLQEAKRRHWVPPEMLGYYQFPDWVWDIPFLDTAAGFLGNLKDASAMVVFFLVTLLLMTGLVSVLYTIFYQLVGPARYSELDAPPASRKTKEYKR